MVPSVLALIACPLRAYLRCDLFDGDILNGFPGLKVFERQHCLPGLCIGVDGDSPLDRFFLCPGVLLGHFLGVGEHLARNAERTERACCFLIHGHSLGALAEYADVGERLLPRLHPERLQSGDQPVKADGCPHAGNAVLHVQAGKIVVAAS